MPKKEKTKAALPVAATASKDPGNPYPGAVLSGVAFGPAALAAYRVITQLTASAERVLLPSISDPKTRRLILDWLERERWRSLDPPQIEAQGGDDQGGPPPAPIPSTFNVPRINVSIDFGTAQSGQKPDQS